MAKLPPDTSFTREGRPLSEWLLDMVSDDAGVRESAGEMIGAMHLALPSAHTDLDDIEGWAPPGHKQQFERAVHDAIALPDFPRRHFLMRAAQLQVAASIEWMSVVKQVMHENDPQFERVIDRIAERANAAPTDEERSSHLRRLARATCASIRRDMERDDDPIANAAAMSIASVNLGIIMPMATAAVAEAPEAVWMMLEIEGTRYLAAELLENAGSTVAPLFLEELLRFYLNELNDSDRWNYARMIANVGRGSDQVITEMLTRVDAPSTGDSEVDIRRVYASILGWMGGDAATPTVIDTFRRFCNSPDDAQRSMAAANLGRLLSDKEEVVERLLALTRDNSLEVVGPAIDSLGELALDPARVVPRLAELLTRFEEYNPDEGYGGDSARICRALRAFGPGAAAAVPALTEYLHLRAQDADLRWRFPSEVLSVLEAVGNAALPALPSLAAVREAEERHRARSAEEWAASEEEDDDIDSEQGSADSSIERDDNLLRLEALIARLENRAAG